ncbi:MAG: ABC transporter ATP-binding protein, partial [Nitrospiraceae bacterium]
MTQALLSVEGLAVTFQTRDGPVYAVRDVSFELGEGEVLGIVGESGAGKTVTCRALLGLLPRSARITGGRIWFKDTDLLTVPEEISRLRGRTLAMIFQTPSTYLDPLMAAGPQIAEGLRFHLGIGGRAARRKVVRLLDDVRIARPEERLHAYPHQLSGGMKQRVMIAGAVASRPSILIADEPTTALDVTVQAEILRLLRELQAEYGLSIILVSHDLGVVAE